MEPFKNALSPAVVALIADQLEKHLPKADQGFDRSAFVGPLVARLASLELKARVSLIADALITVLPDDPTQRRADLLGMLHPDCDPSGESDAKGLQGWAVWPLTVAVARLEQDDIAQGLSLLRQMTKRFTAEFAIRPFLIADQPRVLDILSTWLDDPDPSVRRLVSEGTRPRLPWGERLPALIADPAPVIPLLERLRDDPSEVVRRSVANHLNDIAKDHPQRVIALAELWSADAPPARLALIRHALRSLVKAGDDRALAVLGHEAPRIAVKAPILDQTDVSLGDTLGITATIQSTSRADQNLAVDIVVWFRKADGQLKPKVFKGKQLALAAGQSITFRRNLPLRPVTTRRHHAGEHAIALRINGQDTAKARFTLRL